AAWAMASLAANAEFGHLGAIAAYDILRQSRLGSLARFGVMAKEAAIVPEGCLVEKVVGVRREKGAVGVDPPAFDQVIGNGQAPVAAGIVLGQAFLKPVRADETVDAQRLGRRRAELLQRRAALGRFLCPFCIDRLHEERGALAREARGRAAVLVNG